MYWYCKTTSCLTFVLLGLTTAAVFVSTQKTFFLYRLFPANDFGLLEQRIVFGQPSKFSQRKQNVSFWFVECYFNVPRMLFKVCFGLARKLFLTEIEPQFPFERVSQRCIQRKLDTMGKHLSPLNTEALLCYNIFSS